MALRRMRVALDDPLFVRSAHGIAATPRAASIVEAARPLVAKVSGDLLDKGGFHPLRATQPFVFAMSDVGEMVFLPRLLERLRSQAPSVSVRTVGLTPRELEHSLHVGEVDLAIGYFPDLRKKSFLDQRLFTHRFCCLLRAGHPAIRNGLTREEFLRLGHAVVHPQGRSQEIFEKFLASRRLTRNVVLATPHFMSLPTIIARSDLVATVPHAIGVFFSSWNAEIAVIPPPFQVPKIVLRQHWHARFDRDARSRWIRAQVAELFNDATDEWSFDDGGHAGERGGRHAAAGVGKEMRSARHG
jgi:DNA-binding transcriptional LysR family regulator